MLLQVFMGKSYCDWLFAFGHSTYSAKLKRTLFLGVVYRQQPFLDNIGNWPARISRPPARFFSTTHLVYVLSAYYLACSSVPSVLLIGSISLFIKHQGFIVCCPYCVFATKTTKFKSQTNNIYYLNALSVYKLQIYPSSPIKL